MIKRELLDELINHLKAKEITLITGARQVGKSTLMNELIAHLKKRNKKVLYLNLDFENDKKFFASQELLLQKIKLEIGENGYIFIDEIQRKENAGLFLKGIYDKNLNYKFIVSGSGSLELKEKIQESLAGRKRNFELYPINFLEFINYKTNYRYEKNIFDYFELEIEKTKTYLNEYLCFGGYPRVVTEPTITEKLKIIDELFKSYIDRDIVNLLNVDRPDAFGLLIKILASQIGKQLNFSQLANDTGISVITLKKYLWYLEKTFIIKTISPFFKNSLKELTKTKNIYFNDLGLRNFAIDMFGYILNQNELSFLFQNLVHNILLEKLRWSNSKIHFWRTKDKAEVDFVITRGEEMIPIEVKYMDLKNNTIKRSLRNFIEKYSPKRAIIVNLSYYAIEKIDKTNVIFLPFYKLFLENSIVLSESSGILLNSKILF